MPRTVVSQELLSVEVVKVSSLPFSSRCKVEVIRGVFYQKKQAVLLFDWSAEKSPSSTLQRYAEREREKSRQRERESLIWIKSSPPCCAQLSKQPPRLQGQQPSKCLYGGCLPGFLQKSCPVTCNWQLTWSSPPFLCWWMMSAPGHLGKAGIMSYKMDCRNHLSPNTEQKLRRNLSHIFWHFANHHFKDICWVKFMQTCTLYSSHNMWSFLLSVQVKDSTMYQMKWNSVKLLLKPNRQWLHDYLCTFLSCLSLKGWIFIYISGILGKR